MQLKRQIRSQRAASKHTTKNDIEVDCTDPLSPRSAPLPDLPVEIIVNCFFFYFRKIIMPIFNDLNLYFKKFIFIIVVSHLELFEMRVWETSNTLLLRRVHELPHHLQLAQ